MDNAAAPAAWWRRDPAVELPLTVLVAAAAVAGTYGELRGSPWPVHAPAAAIVLCLVSAGVLLWRRQHPAAVAGVTMAGLAVYHLAGYPGGAPVVAVFVGCYAVAAFGRGGRWLARIAPLLFLGYLALLLPPHRFEWDSPAFWGPGAALAVTVMVGVTARQRRVEAETRLAQAQAVAAAEVGRRLAEQRLRVARDLHDVLAHTISVIGLHTGVALEALDDDSPEAARRSMTVVRSATREAMAELRATLGLLRGEQTDAGTAPHPTLARIPELAARAESAGLDVRVRVGEPGRELPALVELTAVRIVQESLTNVMRHAQASTVTVDVRVEDDELRIDVRDDGPGGPTGGTSGFGLRGMRERVESLGGRLVAGPHPDGGFQVTAALPA